jgi:hypothetical protein
VKYNSGCWHVSADAQFLTQANPHKFCGGKSGTGTGCVPNILVLSLSQSFHRCTILIYMFLLPAGEMDIASEPYKKTCSFIYWGTIQRKECSLLVSKRQVLK